MENKYYNSNDSELLVSHQGECDRWDYLTAVGCGAIAGIIDIFFVGTPGQSKLGDWTDDKTNKVVMAFSKTMGWSPKSGNETNVNSAIGFLERKFLVNYDQRKPSDVENLFNIAPNTHHMMSLAHQPDIIGLFFSILNQFTNTSTFVADGKLITVDTKTFELKGYNFISKIISGVVNWFGHLMSDVAGSSGSHGRGTGIVMPFYGLFGLCKFGKFSDSTGTRDLAEIATAAFNNGYDLRYGTATLIPVVVCDILIRIIWAIRRCFQYGYSLKECIPNNRHSDLRVMLLVGNGVLCVMDAADAAIKSGGQWVNFFMRLNLIAWCKLIYMILKEVGIRLNIREPLAAFVDAIKEVNIVVENYLAELKKIDIEAFYNETKLYQTELSRLKYAHSEFELNQILIESFERLNISLPWKGDFDKFMSDKSSRLVFE